MDRPEDYVKTAQESDVIAVLEEFEDEINQMKGNCLDIGCGPGNVTRKLILPRLPKDIILIGVDISEKMIEYARKTNADEKRLMFKKLDIETTDLPKEEIEGYDNIVSFFCLQWIQDLDRCYRNIHRMLRPGGFLILHTIVSYSIYSTYLDLAKDPRYKPYMKDASKFIGPLNSDKNPRKTVKELVQRIGFKVRHCSLRHKSRLYEREEGELSTLLYSVNPFVDRMPENMKGEFMKNMMHFFKKQSIVSVKKNVDGSEHEQILIRYTFMVVHLVK